MARSDDTPSMMTSGSLPPVREVVPRTRTLFSMAIGFELSVVTLTPAACPFRASNGLVTSPLFILSCVTLSTDPLPSLVRSVSCGALSVTVCARPVAQEASPNSQQPIRCVAFVIGKRFEIYIIL